MLKTRSSRFIANLPRRLARSSASLADLARKIRTPGYRYELRKCGHSPARTVGAIENERIGRLAGKARFPIAEQRIGFADQAVKEIAGNPGVLKKLKLPADVGVEANETQTARRIVRRRGQLRVGGSEAGTVFATAA